MTMEMPSESEPKAMSKQLEHYKRMEKYMLMELIPRFYCGS